MGELRKLVGTRPLFNVGVSVVLLNERGEWLLQRRSDSGLWGVPGGGLEPGETFEVAAARELEEETGLRGVPLLPAGSLSGPECRHVYPHGDEVYMVGMAFRGVLNAAKFAEATLGNDGETLELKFFSLDDLPTLSGGIERLLARRLRQGAGLILIPKNFVTFTEFFRVERVRPSTGSGNWRNIQCPSGCYGNGRNPYDRAAGTGSYSCARAPGWQPSGRPALPHWNTPAARARGKRSRF